MTTKIIAPAKDLLAALTFIRPAIAVRPVTPVLGCVFINPSTGAVIGFDYEVSAKSVLTEFEGEGDRLVVPYSMLVDSVRLITRSDKEASVTITAESAKDGEFVTVESCGYKLVIGSHKADEYPRFDLPRAEKAFTVNGSEMKSLINHSLVAASKDDTLPVLCGVQFEVDDDTLTAMATDRFRLTMNSLPITNASAKVSGTKFLIKGRFLSALAKAMRSAEVPVEVFNEGVRFTLPGGILQTLLINGDFPKIRSLFPESAATTYAIDRKLLVEATTVAQRLAERNTPVVLEFDKNGALPSFAEGLFGSSYAPLVPGEFVSGNEDFTLAFNPEYLIGALRSLSGDQVLLHINSMVKPMMITELDGSITHRHLIMPVRMPKGNTL